jgi:hypothetical protein
LRKACWLTNSQRLELLEGAKRAQLHKKSDSQLCEDIISELEHLENRIESLRPVVRSVVFGLKLPLDALPVYISYAETQQICLYGKISEDL